MTQPVVLLILDGWGHSAQTEWNAIAQGETPLFDRLNAERPPVLIDASGEEVGLPKGQMGNSEVGHLNIGAGRVVYQELLRISNAIVDGTFFVNHALLKAVKTAAKEKRGLHLCGLVSDGGVHSHINHLEALLKMANKYQVEKVWVHAFMDGRDTPPDSGVEYLGDLQRMADQQGARIATVSGRFYAMDRDKRWDRVERAYRALVRGEGEKRESAAEAIRSSYAADTLDEFVAPAVIGDYPGMAEGDQVIMFNFRSDRMREIVRALGERSFAEFDRGKEPPLPSITCMTEYDPQFTYPVAYTTEAPPNGLGEVLARHGLKQLRTAETEKYAHVTFFFNGGVEEPFDGEERKLVPSPKVRTYDLQPSMSCEEVTGNVVAAIESQKFPVIIVNLANGDMVGHTGVWEAALDAVKTVDTQVGRIVEACDEAGAHLIITADHGNIEKMVELGKPMTAHTTNKVPFYYIGPAQGTLRQGGRLADIAPTILELLGVERPAEMTGRPLLTVDNS